MLGSCFYCISSSDYEMITFEKGTDITDFASVNQQLNDLRPSCIIHTAAYTDVDGCELNPKKAYNINVTATKNIAERCAMHSIKMVFFSSTGVYGNEKKTSFVEDDETIPKTIHHQSKLNGELEVSNFLHDYIILRVGWLYGGELSQKNNFIYRRFLEAQGKEFIYSDPEQKGNPTYCGDVVDQTLLLLDQDHRGIFNCVNTAENISRYDYVKEIITQFDINCEVKKAEVGVFTRFAPVSLNESALNKNLNLTGINIMGDWKGSLSKYISKLKRENLI
jgi:dTDP-4-dehydrorhamnose reductase